MRVHRIFLKCITLALLLVSFLLNTFESCCKGEARNGNRKVFSLEFESLSTLERVMIRNETKNFNEKLYKLIKIFVFDYGKWHQEEMKKIYLNNSKAKEASLLLYRGDENYGLGDVIRGLIHSYLIAVVTNRLFFHDIRYKFNINEIWKSQKYLNFSLEDSMFISNHIDAEVYKFKPGFRNLSEYESYPRIIIDTDMPLLRPRSIFSSLAKNKHLIIQQKMKRENLLKYYPKTEELVPFVLNSIFHLSPDFREHMKTIAPFQAKTYIAVHARLGEGVGEENLDRFKISRNELSVKSIGICIGELGADLAAEEKTRNIFVATDTPKARKWIQKGIQRKNLGAIVRYIDEDVIHIAKLGQKGNENSDDLVYSTFVDNALLSNSKAILYIKSGFSDIAIWTGIIQKRIEIDLTKCQEKYDAV